MSGDSEPAAHGPITWRTPSIRIAQRLARAGTRAGAYSWLRPWRGMNATRRPPTSAIVTGALGAPNGVSSDDLFDVVAEGVEARPAEDADLRVHASRAPGARRSWLRSRSTSPTDDSVELRRTRARSDDSESTSVRRAGTRGRLSELDDPESDDDGARRRRLLLPLASAPFEIRAVVGLVEARTLEDDAGGREDLGQLAAAVRVLGERRVGERLERLDLLAALCAAVHVCRHGRSVWTGRRGLALDAYECQSYLLHPPIECRSLTLRPLRVGSLGQNDGAWLPSRSSFPWPGCSGRSRARSSSPGPTAATSCGGFGQPGRVERRTGSLGWRAGALVLLLDFAKGALRPGAGLAIGGRAGACVLGVAAVVGHTYPLYRKGGKGVAAAGGALVVLYPFIVIGLAVVWFVVARVLHKASFASLLATILFPVAVLVAGYERWEVGVVGGIALLVVVRHTANIRRLLRREEIDLGVRPRRLRRPMTRVRKAVIPAAGFGTRFLPATKSSPKEMLPVVDKPAIQYVVEEAVRAGLTDILIITGRNKRAIEDHFDRNFELEHFLENSGQARPVEGSAVRVRSRRHPLRPPARSVGSRPRGVGRTPSRRQRAVRGAAGRRPHGRRRRVAAFDARRARTPRPIVRRVLGGLARGDLVVRLHRSDAEHLADATDRADDVVEIRRVVEKPPRDEAPSNLAIIGRYVFTPEIFTMLDLIVPGRGGELQLTDAIAMLLEQQSVFGCNCRGGRYDVGQKIDFLRANVELALDRSRPRAGVRRVAARVRRRPLARVRRRQE